MADEPENTADESGNANDASDVQSRIDAAVQNAVAGITANRDEILSEKRELKEQLLASVGQLDGLGGKDGVNALLELKTRLEKDEMGKLVAEGKHDEWFDRRTQAMRADFENQMTGATGKLDEVSARADAAESRYTGLKIENEVRSACGSSEGFVGDGATSDALLRAQSTFEYDPKVGVVIRDENGGIVLGKDGSTPKSVPEWLEEQKESSRHWWGISQGAGVNGSTGRGGPAEPSMDAVAKMSASEYDAYRKTKGLSSGYGGYQL